MVEHIDTGIVFLMVIASFICGFVSASDYYTIGDEEEDQ